MWVPEPDWQAVTGAGGSATRGVWRAERDGRPWIVKRLEPAGAKSADVRHHSWWRRESEVARSGILSHSHGLRTPAPITVEEDEHGITLWSPELAATPIDDEVVAKAYGRFSGQSVEDPGWFNRGMLRHRIAATDAVGGLRPLRDSGLLDDSLLRKCDVLWSRRAQILDELDLFPKVLSHGDALPRNMLCMEGQDVIAVDWGQLGYNTVGADLATFCLYSMSTLGDLLGPYCDGLNEGDRTFETVTVRGATVQSAALIATSRASRALAMGGEVQGYVARLVRAEPLIREALATG